MVTLELNLPAELAQRARQAGLLTDEAIQTLLSDAIRQIAERREAGQRLLEIASRLHDDGVPAMSDDDLMAEIAAHRAAKRASARASAACA